MAFKNLNLAVACMCSDWTNFVYRDTHEDTTEMEKIGYFNPVATILNTGDLITLVGKDTVKQKYVFINKGEVILMELGK